VNHRGAARLRAGHPWVYRSDLVPPAEAADGSLVQVRDERGRRLGSALYSSASQIAIRLLSTDEISDNALPVLVRERINQAVQVRQCLTRDTDSFRVIFSEADLLPGLIVDKYNDILAVQAVTQALDREDLRQIVVESLTAHFPGASLIERIDPHIRELEQLPPRESRSLEHHLRTERRAVSL
jgi:23S rRNA (cytosine1962-C5)-methyltransferase